MTAAAAAAALRYLSRLTDEIFTSRMEREASRITAHQVHPFHRRAS